MPRPLFAASQIHEQGAGSEVEYPGLKPSALLWDERINPGDGLTHYAATPTLKKSPHFFGRSPNIATITETMTKKKSLHSFLQPLKMLQ